MNEQEGIQAVVQHLLRLAFFADTYYTALRDLRMPDTLIHELVCDWHRAVLDGFEGDPEGIIGGGLR